MNINVQLHKDSSVSNVMNALYVIVQIRPFLIQIVGGLIKGF